MGKDIVYKMKKTGESILSDKANFRTKNIPEVKMDTTKW